MRNTAIISENSPRYEEWRAVFGTDEVPIVNILVPNKASVLGEVRDVYMLDLRKLTDEQTGRLIEHLARKFNIPPLDVQRDLHQHGVPLLAEDLLITTDQMFFLRKEPMEQPHWEIRLGKGNDEQPNMRRVQIFSVEMGVEVVLAGTVEHVSTMLFLLMDTWMQQHAPALAEELLNQLAAMDFFDANQIIEEFVHEHHRNSRAER